MKIGQSLTSKSGYAVCEAIEVDADGNERPAGFVLVGSGGRILRHFRSRAEAEAELEDLTIMDLPQDVQPERGPEPK